MSHPNSFDDGDDGAGLESLLSPLKRIEPTTKAREEFRAAVAIALARDTVVRSRSPWWRRSVAVPVPVALSVAILICATITWSVNLSWQTDERAIDSRPRGMPVAPSLPLPVSRSPVELRRVPPSMNIEHITTEVYVCGVGPVKSTSSYIVRE